jgi:hypothetical protein
MGDLALCGQIRSVLKVCKRLMCGDIRAGNTQVTPFDTTIEEGALQEVLLHVARNGSRNQPSRDDVFSG